LVASTILECLLSKAAIVPGAIRLLAVNALTPLVDVEGGTLEVTNGQMMGSYLSFPLLCLQSYLAALWATRGQEASILVNGDDTLISTDRPVASESYPSGFLLNDKKTIRSKGVAEINSTCFLKDGKGRWRLVHHLRRGSACADFPGMLHLAAACRGQVRWTDAFIRSRIGASWGLTPLQLGLHPMSYPAFQRMRELRRRRWDTPLPSGVQAPSEALRLMPGEPTREEVYALAYYLKDNGREGGRKRDVFSPTRGEVRRSFLYRAVGPRSCLSWYWQLLKARAHDTGKTRTYCVPAQYVTREEQEGERELLAWKQALVESADA